MKVQRYYSLGLAALNYALALSSSYVMATTTTTSDSPPTTSSDATPTGCVTSYIGDGDCDLYNNNEDCGGYDGGDCCECTCVTTAYFTCGAGYHGGFTCIDPSAECVDDDDVTTLPEYEDNSDSSASTTTYTDVCIPGYVKDGYCDEINNDADCDFDGGDCCECTCVSTENYTCGEDSSYMRGFACKDPDAPCAGDDDFDPATYDYTTYYSTDDLGNDSGSSSSSSSSSSSLCLDGLSGDGKCDSDTNIEECGYDGGDCCECDCVDTSDWLCGENEYVCIDPSSSCINGYVLASTKTTITASANAYDTRAGEASGDIGCGEDGCAPALSLDGISVDIESRWSCKQTLVLDGEPCEIEFTFNDPQDIMEVQVAFWKGDERSRTLEAAINGEVIGEFNSYAGSTFNALGIEGVGVNTFSLKYVDVADNGWISLIEVRFLVEP